MGENDWFAMSPRNLRNMRRWCVGRALEAFREDDGSVPMRKPRLRVSDLSATVTGSAPLLERHCSPAKVPPAASGVEFAFVNPLSIEGTPLAYSPKTTTKAEFRVFI